MYDDSYQTVVEDSFDLHDFTITKLSVAYYMHYVEYFLIDKEPLLFQTSGIVKTRLS